MPWMPDGAEVSSGFGKLVRLHTRDSEQGLELRGPPEYFGWYLVDGVRQFRVSSKARRSGAVGRGRLRALQRYLRLSPVEFQDLCQCRMTGPQYHQVVRDRLGL